jgi:UDP-2,3-diacylglucosamine hydrolase
VLFISDLHLDTDRPEVVELFEDFAAQEAAHADALYILGDLFEAWVGDDDSNASIDKVIAALAQLSNHGVACHFMHGNRDFLVGERFAAATGCKLLGDYETIEVYGTPLLLTHGDLLCTDDDAYIDLRATVRDPEWQSAFLDKPLAERRKIAADMRAVSRTEVAAKPSAIMDVNATAVRETMQRFGVHFLLHGHTHRPGIHEFDLDEHAAARIVLGDWHKSGSLVRWSEQGFTLEDFPSRPD